ncbi:MAG: uncharacterized protein JWQ94_326 [Tardiphaga sp.]|jgi:hypothetical protein|nr:uncharacterized protein [Tardiphaga sp.]
MPINIDDLLTSDQWDALRALRPSALSAIKLNGYILQQLDALELVVLSDAAPRLTPKGRAVVLRGSPRLWDVAA